ncbi:MAG: hypothetical protein PVJ49_02620 [Acidobacteriota bacterium]|jgi:hypothetical protein
MGHVGSLRYLVTSLLLLVLPGVARAQAQWLDAAGRPLPFYSAEEVLDFLRTATVLEREALPNGITHPEKVLLEKNGVQAHAIFRGYRRQPEVSIDPITGEMTRDDLNDSGIAEAAAYELAVLLELPFVPPTVRRIIDNREGTLQLWIEHASTARDRMERGEKPPNADWWRGITQTLAIFDNLLFNTDRHVGNLLIDERWNVWFIDHTRAFQPHRELRNPEVIEFSERRLWERLRDLPDEIIRECLAPYLDESEMMSLLARRHRLVNHIGHLIDERGERAVLFDYSYDLSMWRDRRR